MIRFNIEVYWPSEDVFKEIRSRPFAKRCQAFLRELAPLHPWVAHLGYPARRTSKTAIDVIDMTLDRFATYVLREQTSFNLATETIKDGPYINIYFSHGQTSSPGKCWFSAAPEFWNNEELVRRIFALMIDFWQPHDGGILASAPQSATNYDPNIPTFLNSKWYFWLKWHRDGALSTIPHLDERVIGTPSSAEPWKGGTLYTWPEHEPKKLLAELGNTAQ